MPADGSRPLAAGELVLRAPAKLNLFLHILGRRPDGYHVLQTLFRLVDLCDEVGLTRAPAGEIAFAPGSDGPGGDDDLCLRAARLLAARHHADGGVRIDLRKRIPAGGGLGGGSSDAAAVLLGLDALWGLALPRQTLLELALELGADVPVFVLGHSAWAEGIGERLEPVDLPPDHYLICHPRVHVETARVFGDAELTRDTPAIRIRAFLSQGGRNDCERVVRRLYPQVADALDWLSARGEARLTGTGGCCFLRCADEAQAEAVAAELPDDLDGYVVRGLNISPVIEQLASRSIA